MKLNLCCGGNILDGFDNHDMDVDITKPLPFADCSAEYILIEHGLEHVNCLQGFEFLKEAFRVLKPGGVLRICVPILGRIMKRSDATDLIVNHGHQMVYDWEIIREMLWCAGFDLQLVKQTARSPYDGHWKVIGKEKDDLETMRVEATK